MGETKTCPSCHKEIPPNSTHCIHCQKELVPLLPAVVTKKIPEGLFAKTDSIADKHVPNLERADGIALVVRGSDDPILVSEEDFIIGRYDPDSTQPTVDLSLYNAGALGVSRRHARIHRQGDVYLVEDLNSTNGTWLNQVRVPAGKVQGLPNGATIQLGQLVLYFYSNSLEAVRTVEEYIRFKGVDTRLTPDYLATHICPYLTALAQVQAVCDDMTKRPSTPVQIGAIIADDPQLISVRLTGARDALKLAKGQLILWRSEQGTKIDQIANAKPGPNQHPASPTNDPAATNLDIGKQATQTLSGELREAETRLADDFLRSLAPHTANADRKPFVDKLLEPLGVLAFSPLIVLTGADSN